MTEWTCPQCGADNTTQDILSAVCKSCNFRAYPFFSDDDNWDLFRDHTTTLEKSLDEAEERFKRFKMLSRGETDFIRAKEIAHDVNESVLQIIRKTSGLPDGQYRMKSVMHLHNRATTILEQCAIIESSTETAFIDSTFKK